MRNIIDIPPAERPRERLIERGASTLSDEELLAVILGSGSSTAGVGELAQKVLEVVDRENGGLRVDSVLDIAGIGTAKATLLCAAHEFVKRRIRPEGLKIRQPSDVVPLVNHLLDRKQECFVVITLNGAHEVIETRIITIGLLNFCNVHPREVFCDAISDRAAAIIAIHNHPSGNVDPSNEDRKVTNELIAAGKLLGIPLLDHVIVGKSGYFSFKEREGIG